MAKKTTNETKNASTTTTVATRKVARFINENGEVNIGSLTDEQKQKCRDITKNLSASVTGSVNNYGIELQSKLANSGKSFLASTKTSHSGEIGNIMKTMLVSLDKINLKDVQDPNAIVRFMRKVPILNKLTPSLKKIVAKYQTLEESMEEVEEHVKASILATNQDNNELQLMFNDTAESIKQIESYIVAGKLAIEEEKARIEEMRAANEDEIKIQDEINYVNSLEKKVHDLLAVRQVSRQNLSQIRIIQQNNLIACDNAQSVLTLVMPIFRNQLALAVSLQDQKDAIDAYNIIREKANEAIVQNSKTLQDNSIAIAQASQQSLFSVESISASAENLKNTIEKVKEVVAIAQAKRKEEEKQFAQLENTLASLSRGELEIKDTAVKNILID